MLKLLFIVACGAPVSYPKKRRRPFSFVPLFSTEGASRVWVGMPRGAAPQTPAPATYFLRRRATGGGYSSHSLERVEISADLELSCDVSPKIQSGKRGRFFYVFFWPKMANKPSLRVWGKSFELMIHASVRAYLERRQRSGARADLHHRSDGTGLFHTAWAGKTSV